MLATTTMFVAAMRLNPSIDRTANDKRAKHATSDLVSSKEVTVQSHRHDKDGRASANVLIPDGTNVNHALVKDG